MRCLQDTTRAVLALWLALAPVKAWAGSMTLLGAGGPPIVAQPMKTPLMAGGQGAAPSNTANNVASINGGQWGTSTARDVPMAIAGTLSGLTVRFPTAVAAGSYAVNLLKNGSAAGTPGSMSCSLTAGATTCSDNTNTVSVAAGDTLMWQVVPTGTPTAQTTGVSVSALFTSTSNGESVITSGTTGASPSTVAASYATFGTLANWATTEVNASGIMPTSGVIDQFYVSAGLAPGAAKTVVYTVVQNGALTSLTCSMNGSGSGSGITTCNDVNAGHAITLAATDTISIQACPGSVSGGVCTASGTPTTDKVRASVRWRPTIPGEAVAMTVDVTALSITSDRFVPMVDTIPSASENIFSLAPVDFTVKKTYFALDVAPGAGTPSRSITLRAGSGTQANAGTPSAIGCTLTTTTQCSDTANTYAAASGILLDWLEHPANTPAATVFYKISNVMLTN